MIKSYIKVSVTEVDETGTDSVVLTLATTPAHPTKFILECMGQVSLIERDNLKAAYEKIMSQATILEL